MDLLTPAQVAKILGITRPRVYQMEDRLQPITEARGQRRRLLYRREVIEQVRAERAANGDPKVAASIEPAFAGLHKRARRHDMHLDVTELEARELAQRPCVLCACPPSGALGAHDLAALDPSQPWTAANIAPFCPACLHLLDAEGSHHAGSLVGHLLSVVRHQLEAISGQHLGEVVRAATRVFGDPPHSADAVAEMPQLGAQLLALLSPLTAE